MNAPADFEAWTTFAEILRRQGWGSEVRRILKWAKSVWNGATARGNREVPVEPGHLWRLIALALYTQRQAAKGPLRDSVSYLIDLAQAKRVTPTPEDLTTAKMGWQAVEREVRGGQVAPPEWLAEFFAAHGTPEARRAVRA